MFRLIDRRNSQGGMGEPPVFYFCGRSRSLLGTAPAYKEFRLDDVYLEQFQRDDNAQAFAAAYTGFFKAAYEPCLFVNLSDKHTPENRQHVIDLFSQKLESALAQDPKKYSCRWVLHLMLISKKQK